MYHRRPLVHTLAVAGLGLAVLGGAVTANAAARPATTDTTPTTEAPEPTDATATTDASAATDDDQDEGEGDDDVSYTSSVTIDDGRPTPTEVVELATVSAADAVAAALAGTPGTATRVGLRVVDGNVVWRVHVLDDAGATSKVTVDAGDASILDTQVGDAPLTSSVTIDDGGRPSAADLAAVATVPVADAIAAALADTPGTAVTASLHSEDGNVVWLVGVLDEAGEGVAVIVDAGNASVLDIRTDPGPGRRPGGRGLPGFPGFPGDRDGRGGPGPRDRD